MVMFAGSSRCIIESTGWVENDANRPPTVPLSLEHSVYRQCTSATVYQQSTSRVLSECKHNTSQPAGSGVMGQECSLQNSTWLVKGTHLGFSASPYPVCAISVRLCLCPPEWRIQKAVLPDLEFLSLVATASTLLGLLCTHAGIHGGDLLFLELMLFSEYCLH